EGLWTAMRSRGRDWIGTALTIRDDPAETAIVSNPADFNSITPENAQKWESIEPSRNNFTFAAADAHVEFAVSRGYKVHCHNLVWHSQLPAWVSEGNFDNATLISIMKNHINKLAGRYRGKCSQWDVVNEALNEDGTYRESVFYNTIGEAFIPIAFQMARKADPYAELYYNDYNLEYNNAKTLGAQRIVKLIQSYGVEIQGVGLQAHLTSEPTPSAPTGTTPSQDDLETVLRGYTDLGVDVAYTEIDVRHVTPGNATTTADQVKAYERIAASCLAVKRCVGMTIWGVSDKYSWIPGVFPGEGEANLWDENLKRKPAYDGFLAGIQNGGKKTPGPAPY
ncbi:glycoside hydrolase family 10 protein, partial [Cercospora zeae-maydis SCOH1-5]